jgi:hypothetical protein
MSQSGGRFELTSTFDVERSPDQVFAFLADTANFGAVDPALIGYSPTGLLRAGLHGRFAHRRGPMVARTTRTIMVAVLLAACGSPLTSPAPAVPAWTPPPEWVTVSNAESTFQLTLPPYIQVGDRRGAIFANEAPPPGESEIPIQLWAQGPIIDDGPRAGEELDSWVERRLDSRVKGVPTVTPVSLPAGDGIRYDRVDAAGTPNAWRIVVFAIETPRGAAWLMIDGPPDEWAARANDLERIPTLFRVR